VQTEGSVMPTILSLQQGGVSRIPPTLLWGNALGARTVAAIHNKDVGIKGRKPCCPI
jgi:hypothetical protein